MSKHETTIEELVARWDELRADGRDVSADELCAGCPELTRRVQSRIEQLKAMDWLDEVASPDGLEPAPLHSEETSLPVALDLPITLGGRYELTNVIADGGFGQVWRGHDTTLDRSVAVKVTQVDCQAEARRVARLKHHGIVSVHDVGKDNGFCYIVFDLVEGQTLAERIKENSLTWQESAAIVAKVAEYVHYAHEKGFIHRDIKPANILLDEKGKPVLADFGIAVTQCELEREGVTSVGTLAYMSPEQLTRGAVIDARTDVYGLGVVLYELLTGAVPFAGRTMSGLRNKILAGGPTSPRALNRIVPVALEHICLRCLSVVASDRYASADELSRALRAVLAETPSV